MQRTSADHNTKSYTLIPVQQTLPQINIIIAYLRYHHIHSNIYGCSKKVKEKMQTLTFAPHQPLCPSIFAYKSHVQHIVNAHKDLRTHIPLVVNILICTSRFANRTPRPIPTLHTEHTLYNVLTLHSVVAHLASVCAI